MALHQNHQIDEFPGLQLRCLLAGMVHGMEPKVFGGPVVHMALNHLRLACRLDAAVGSPAEACRRKAARANGVGWWWSTPRSSQWRSHRRRADAKAPRRCDDNLDAPAIMTSLNFWRSMGSSSCAAVTQLGQVQHPVHDKTKQLLQFLLLNRIFLGMRVRLGSRSQDGRTISWIAGRPVAARAGEWGRPRSTGAAGRSPGQWPLYGEGSLCAPSSTPPQQAWLPDHPVCGLPASPTQCSSPELMTTCAGSHSRCSRLHANH